MSNLRWKITLIVTVFAVFFGFGVYPILAARYNLPAPQWLRDRQLKLGLDLRGGVHLVLRVQTDDALRVRPSRTAPPSGRAEASNVPATVAFRTADVSCRRRAAGAGRSFRQAPTADGQLRTEFGTNAVTRSAGAEHRAGRAREGSRAERARRSSAA